MVLFGNLNILQNSLGFKIKVSYIHIMKISYAVTVSSELDEVKRLIPFLLEHIQRDDEIVVLWDNKGDSNVYNYLRDTFFLNKIIIRHGEFKGHFADWKNHLNSLCTGDFMGLGKKSR